MAWPPSAKPSVSVELVSVPFYPQVRGHRSGGANCKPDEAMDQSLGLLPGPLPDRIQGMGLSRYSLPLGYE